MPAPLSFQPVLGLGSSSSQQTNSVWASTGGSFQISGSLQMLHFLCIYLIYESLLHLIKSRLELYQMSKNLGSPRARLRDRQNQVVAQMVEIEEIDSQPGMRLHYEAMLQQLNVSSCYQVTSSLDRIWACYGLPDVLDIFAGR